MSYLQLDADHPRSVSKRLLQGIPLGQGLKPRCSYCLFDSDYPYKQNAEPKRCKTDWWRPVQTVMGAIVDVHQLPPSYAQMVKWQTR